jgi:hypothetical protein
MNCKRLLWLSLVIFFSMCSSLWARTQRASLCSLQDNPEKFLNLKVEVQASVFAGVEYPRITDEKCSFRFAYGDDYQIFGDRFPINNDHQWKLLKEVLRKTECASNVRVAKATITGTVVRVPATGTTPQKEMPFELVIQSVSDVSRVPVKCTPRAAHFTERTRGIWRSAFMVSLRPKAFPL